MAGLHPHRVLDAGCGTGRVARELARRGIEVVGVDRDASMIATARRLAPELDWVQGDAARVDLAGRFDVVVMAGNVPSSHRRTTGPSWWPDAPATWRPAGSLVAGFQLDRGYSVARVRRALPPGGPGHVRPLRHLGPGGLHRWGHLRGVGPPLVGPAGPGRPGTPTTHAIAPGPAGSPRGDRRPSGRWDLRSWVTPGEDTMRNPMFVYDEQLTSLILDYCRWRLALDPVPLDFGGAQAASLDASLKGLINPGGHRCPPGHGDLRQRAGHRGGVVRQPALPLVHPGGADQGLAALRHGGGVLVAAGDVVDGGRRGGGRREPGPRRPVPTWPGCPTAPEGHSCPVARPATSRP